MNCSECIIFGNDCKEIYHLFDRLSISRQEQFVLLKMARDKLNYTEFKRILNYVCKTIKVI
jgi:hypothetical protein